MTRYGLRSTWAWFLLAVAVLCVGVAARAQALPTAKGPGSNVDVGGGISVFQQDYGQRYIGGTTIYADVSPHWRYGAELEARFLNQNASQQVTMRTYLGGFRMLLRPHVSTLQPYAKFLVGTGHISLPFGYGQGNFLTYAPGGGVDVALGDFVKWRAVDFEYQKWPDFPYGGLRPYGITTGIIFRLNPLRRYPEGSPGRNTIPR